MFGPKSTAMAEDETGDELSASIEGEKPKLIGGDGLMALFSARRQQQQHLLFKHSGF